MKSIARSPSRAIGESAQDRVGRLPDLRERTLRLFRIGPMTSGSAEQIVDCRP
jgi:hypothetical protein